MREPLDIPQQPGRPLRYGWASVFVLSSVLLLLGLVRPTLAQDTPPNLIVSPLAVSVGKEETATYTVHFDTNPADFDGVECGETVYVNMRGFDYSTLQVDPFTPAFRTGTDCTGGNWDNPRTIQVKPVAGTEATVTILHAVWDDHGGTPLEDTGTPKVVVTIYDEAPTPPEPWVSIEAGSSSWTEGNAVTFTLTRGNDNIARTVDVSVIETGEMLRGTPPTSVVFAANSDTATLVVQTVDDDMDEDDSVITATITVPPGFQTSDRQLLATATVMDNDDAPDTDTPWVSIEAGSSSSTEGTLSRSLSPAAMTISPRRGRSM